MGYILPIQHFTYQEYQQRMEPSQVNYHNVSRLYPVTFHVDSKSDSLHLKTNTNETQTKMSTPLSIDGKGEYINTYV